MTATMVQDKPFIGQAADNLRRFAQRAWWALLLRGLLSLAVGVFVLVRPLGSIAALALLIAVWALVSGFVNIISAFELKPVLRHWWVQLLSGLAGVGFGVAALHYYPVLSLAFAVVGVSWWLLLTGTLEGYAAFAMKQMGASWGWTALLGFLSIVAGVFALMFPPVTLAALMGLIAGFALVIGFVLVVGAFRVRALVRG